MLQSCKNTQSMKNLVMKAARAKFRRRTGLRAVFEHGHWWLIVKNYHGCDGDGTFDVVDAEGPGSIYGLDFEEV